MSLILAVVMILGNLTGAHADSDKKIQTLQEKGIIEGRVGGDLDLDARITRAEAIKNILYSLGYEKECEALKGQKSFYNVNDGHWASGIIAFAKNFEFKNGI